MPEEMKPLDIKPMDLKPAEVKLPEPEMKIPSLSEMGAKLLEFEAEEKKGIADYSKILEAISRALSSSEGKEDTHEFAKMMEQITQIISDESKHLITLQTMIRELKHEAPEKPFGGKEKKPEKGSEKNTEKEIEKKMGRSIADFVKEAPNFYERLAMVTMENKMTKEESKDMANKFVRHEKLRSEKIDEPIKRTAQSKLIKYCVCLNCGNRKEHNQNITCSEEICECGSHMIGDRG